MSFARVTTKNERHKGGILAMSDEQNKVIIEKITKKAEENEGTHYYIT